MNVKGCVLVRWSFHSHHTYIRSPSFRRITEMKSHASHSHSWIWAILPYPLLAFKAVSSRGVAREVGVEERVTKEPQPQKPGVRQLRIVNPLSTPRPSFFSPGGGDFPREGVVSWHMYQAVNGEELCYGSVIIGQYDFGNVPIAEFFSIFFYREYANCESGGGTNGTRKPEELQHRNYLNIIWPRN